MKHMNCFIPIDLTRKSANKALVRVVFYFGNGRRSKKRISFSELNTRAKESRVSVSIIALIMLKGLLDIMRLEEFEMFYFMVIINSKTKKQGAMA